MFKRNKFRVRVAINNYQSEPRTRYIIEKRTILGWFERSDETGNKEWAYTTCAEMNAPYVENQKNLVDVIGAKCGWKPLKNNQQMTVNFGQNEYLIKRTK